MLADWQVPSVNSPRKQLDERFARAFAAAFPDLEPEGDLVVAASNPQHGDYQCNQALALARQLKSRPRDIAAKVLKQLDVTDLCEAPEIAGPGFVNLTLRPGFLAQQVAERVGDPRLGVDPAPARTLVIDYSSPNAAKPMHVGHIRSTVIGDALARTLRFVGHQVIADNHLGDWGTQFGQLIVGWRDFADHDALAKRPMEEIKRVYQAVKEREEQDPAFKERVRQELVALQGGAPEQTAIWEELIALSRRYSENIYQRLGVQFDVWHGESFYNSMLAEVVTDLENRGIAREDQGAVVVFFDTPTDPPNLKPLLIRKSDGAYLYGTTDLAAIKYRVDTWNADLLVYVTDGRQQDHFKQVFQTARKWGYTQQSLEHVWFGTIQGEDRKPYKTREGDTPDLLALLDEAEERALAIVREKQPHLSPELQQRVARVVGLGAVKYFDLSQARTSDYVFSWDKMLAMNGNTAPYMQYAFVRINSILEKCGIDPATLCGPLTLDDPAERSLARAALELGDAIEETAATYRPNVLTTFLYEVASQFSTFYERCPVLAADEAVRTSRLTLCRLVARTLELGLSLLGIETLPRM